MSCSVTSVFTFKIESTFDEWAAIFDSEEANKRHSEFDISRKWASQNYSILKKRLAERKVAGVVEN